MDPQQEIFTAILLELKDSPYGDSVYDGYLPPAGVAYPFIYLGDSQLQDEMLKGVVLGRVFQHIDVYSNNPRARGTVSMILLAIKNICRRIEHTGNFSWSVEAVSEQIVPDSSTDEPLLHGYLDLTFRFS